MVTFEDMNLLARANNFAFYELLGDAALMNTELDRYLSVTKEDIDKAIAEIFREENTNTLYYLAKKK